MRGFMKKRSLRCWAGMFGLAAIFTPIYTTWADDRTSFIIDMTHAFYAKAYCSNIDIAYENFAKLAEVKHLNGDVVEEVRKGVAFLNTNGQTGEKARKDTMDTIVLAAKMIAVDHKTTGVDSWCKFRTRSLLESGFIKTVEATPSREALDKRLDEQFAEMRKSMPIQVSTISKLTNAYRSGMTLNYTYEDSLPADKWSEADKKKLLADVTKTQCGGKNTQMLIDLGYAFGATHVDEKGKFIAHLFVDKGKCQ